MLGVFPTALLALGMLGVFSIAPLEFHAQHVYNLILQQKKPKKHIFVLHWAQLMQFHTVEHVQNIYKIPLEKN